MKKAILHPLCSALVVPGLGQIMNRQIKKGGMILAAAFILFIAGAVRLAFMVKAVLESPGLDRLQPEEILERIQSQNFVLLWILLAVFAFLWLYSVLDAYVEGRRLDRSGGEDIG